MNQPSGQRPEEASNSSRFSDNRLVWVVVLAAVLVFLCIGLMAAGILISLATQREEKPLLPPPPTFTPLAMTPLESDSTPLPTTLPVEPDNGQVTALHLDVPPTIDGDLGDWAGSPAFTASHIVEQEASWDGTMDVTSAWQVGWDSQNLYLAVAVTDDVHVQTNPAKFAYLGDSLELQLDTNLTGDYGAGVSNDDFQYILSPGDFSSLPASVFRFRGNEQGNMVDFFGSQATITAVQTPNGYNLEAAIPWSDLNMQPEASLIVGAAFSLNDLDTPGTAVQELMLSQVNGRRWLDPSSWGSVVLAP